MGKILVIGSSNTDLIARVKKFPVAGETIEGLTFFQAMGGKGANQAVAAHRAGGDVSFITCLGNDVNGENTLKYYHQEGLDVSLSLQIDGVSSGTAMIWVNEQGENCIVVTAGANNKLSPDYIKEMKEAIVSSSMVVMQMEIPYEAIKTACEIAHENGKMILLNVAPARHLEAELIKKIGVLVVNENEAETISGRKMSTEGTEIVVDSLLAMGARVVVLTMGERGCMVKSNQSRYLLPAYRVKAKDTTAAGDTFCGALAARLSKGISWEEALKFATAASAICVMRMGAQPSIPMESEIHEFMANHDDLRFQ